MNKKDCESSFQKYWHENQEQIIWNAWITKYSAYINPDFVQQNTHLFNQNQLDIVAGPSSADSLNLETITSDTVSLNTKNLDTKNLDSTFDDTTNDVNFDDGCLETERAENKSSKTEPQYFKFFGLDKKDSTDKKDTSFTFKKEPILPLDKKDTIFSKDFLKDPIFPKDPNFPRDPIFTKDPVFTRDPIFPKDPVFSKDTIFPRDPDSLAKLDINELNFRLLKIDENEVLNEVEYQKKAEIAQKNHMLIRNLSGSDSTDRLNLDISEGWNPLSPASAELENETERLLNSRCGSHASSSVRTVDSLTNVTRMTVSSIDLSDSSKTTDSISSVSSVQSSLSSSSSDDADENPDHDQHWTYLWKKNYEEEYREHYRRFVARFNGEDACAEESGEG